MKMYLNRRILKSRMCQILIHSRYVGGIVGVIYPNQKGGQSAITERSRKRGMTRRRTQDRCLTIRTHRILTSRAKLTCIHKVQKLLSAGKVRKLFLNYQANNSVQFAVCVVLFTAVLCCLGKSYAQDKPDEPFVAGFVEYAILTNKKVKFTAKLDTGAKTSSIHALEYETLDREGRQWIRFSIKSNRGRLVPIERPVVRYTKIRRAGTKIQKRPVIELDLCVAGQRSVAEFTVANRSELNYPFLIGRQFLKGRILVDSSKTFIGSGKC